MGPSFSPLGKIFGFFTKEGNLDTHKTTALKYLLKLYSFYNCTDFSNFIFAIKQEGLDKTFGV